MGIPSHPQLTGGVKAHPVLTLRVLSGARKYSPDTKTGSKRKPHEERAVLGGVGRMSFPSLGVTKARLHRIPSLSTLPSAQVAPAYPRPG